MKLCTYNILEGGVGRIDPLAEVLRLSGAEVIIIQEAWDAALFHRLADRLHMDRFLAENPRTATGAVGLLTRWEIREATNAAAVDPRLTRSAFTARVTRSGKELALVGLHLHARETPGDEAIRLAEWPAIEQLARTLPAAHVLCGDFNTSHPDQVIDIARLRPKVRQRLEAEGRSAADLPRDLIRQVLAAGYADAHALFRRPADFDVTLTTAHPGMRVDYILVAQALAGRVKSCEVFKPEIAKFASDHYPVVAELDLG